jgi:ABC-type transporter Mla subunit MlaD
MSFQENKGLWLSVGAAILAVVALVWLLVSGGPRTLVILFPESGDLKREDPVIWHDYVVGRVTKIEPLVDNQVGVTIRLSEDYAARITRGSRFTLKRAALFGMVGSNAVEIQTPSEAGLPYLDGEKIQGEAPPRPTIVEQGKGVALDYWEQLKKQASNLMAEYDRSPYRKDIEDALVQLKALADKGMGLAKEEWEAFAKSHQKEFDSIIQKLEQARDWMLKKGDEAGARRLQEEIDKLKKK